MNELPQSPPATRPPRRRASHRRFAPNLRTLMLIIVAGALAFAALRDGSRLAFQICYTLTVAALIVAAIAARYRSGSRGAFWFGTALTGWALFLVGHDANGGFVANPNLLPVAWAGRARTQLVDFMPPTRVADSADFLAQNERWLATEGLLVLLIVAVIAPIGGGVAVWIAGRQPQDRPGNA